MEKSLNQSLVIHLEMLSLEPAGSCFSVQGEEGEGSFYVFNRNILAASYADLSGEEAVRHLLDKKESWIFDNSQAYPQSADLTIYMEAVLVDLLSSRKREKTGEKTSGAVSFKRQTLTEQYELNISVQGGSWDGQIFALFPGDNPISKLADAVSGSGNPGTPRTNAGIVVGDSQARIMDFGSAQPVLLNGRAVREAVLSPEDVITLGEVALKLHYVVRQPISIRVSAERKKGDIENESSSQAVQEGKTINWKQFAPRK